MKVKLLSILLLFISPFIFSQTIKGKIVFNNYAIPNVEVINSNSKTLTVSDANGHFSIATKMNDILVFVAKDYELKRIVINPLIIKDEDLSIELVLKVEELEEVVITKIPSIKLSSDAKYGQGKLDKYGLERSTYTPKVIGVNMGTIENGMDFVEIGKMLFGGLFKGTKEGKDSAEIDFKEVVISNFDQKFYTQTLKLKEEEIGSFLDYCNFDPESKRILSENSNSLVLMDFLIKKSKEYEKLHAPE